MAKGRSSSILQQNIQKNSDTKKHAEAQSKQWKEFRNKIDTILMSNNIMRNGDTQKNCLALNTMTPTEREQHILSHWGPLYLSKVSPLLQQLAILESQIAITQSILETENQ